VRNAPTSRPSPGRGLPPFDYGPGVSACRPGARQRQLYQIAELGKPKANRRASKVHAAAGCAETQNRGRGLDFRDEVMAQIFDRDQPTPKRTRRSYRSDDDGAKQVRLFQRLTFSNCDESQNHFR